jgi:hypothetical protein
LLVVEHPGCSSVSPLLLENAGLLIRSCRSPAASLLKDRLPILAAASLLECRLTILISATVPVSGYTHHVRTLSVNLLLNLRLPSAIISSLVLTESTSIELRSLSLSLAILPLLLSAALILKTLLSLPVHLRHLLTKHLSIRPLCLPVELRLLPLWFSDLSLLCLSVPLGHLPLHLRTLLLLSLHLRELTLSLPVHLRHLPLHLRHRPLCLLPHLRMLSLLRLLSLHLRRCLALLMSAASISSAVTASFPLRGDIAETAQRDHQQ